MLNISIMMMMMMMMNKIIYRKLHLVGSVKRCWSRVWLILYLYKW